MFLAVPEERIGVLIGPDGKTRALLQKRTGCRIDVDSEEGRIEITGSDPYAEMRAGDVVKAMARGFSPERALRLLQSEDQMLEIIEIPADNPNDLQRIAGRIIGRDGRTRTIIEETTGVHLSVFGKTVSLIGGLSELQMAREALGMLFDGSPHGAVYKFLERRARGRGFEF